MDIVIADSVKLTLFYAQPVFKTSHYILSSPNFVSGVGTT